MKTASATLPIQEPAEPRSAVSSHHDHKDIKPSPSLEKLFDKLDRANRSGGSILVFTILYGNDADPETLRELAKRTNGKYYKGLPSFPGIERRENIDSIHKVFTDPATFF